MGETAEFTTDLDDAVAPLVLAIDVGSTGSRAGLFDARGVPVGGHRHKEKHAFTTSSDGTAVIDPDLVVDEVATCIDKITHGLPSGAVAAVGIDTFASSLVGTDASGAAQTPCFTYADSRCASEVAELAGRFDVEQLQDWTGTRLHTSYLAPRLAWLRRTEPHAFAASRRWLSLGEYVQLHLAGATAVGTSTASWSGLLDRRTGSWVPELLEAAHVSADQFSPILDPDQAVPGADAGHRWPGLASSSWLAPVSDGLASNIGCGADGPRTMALSMATSGAVRVIVDSVPDEVPVGLWCYRVGAGRNILGGALNDVGRCVGWLESTIRLPEDVDLDSIAGRPPDAATPLMLPFLTGERSTGWRGDARAILSHVTASTDGPAIARAALEGIALSYNRIHVELHKVAPEVERVLANGRVARDLPHLTDVVADALDLPIDHVSIPRTTLRGTALLALDLVAPQVKREPIPAGRRSDPAHREYFSARAERFAQLYQSAYGS